MALIDHPQPHPFWLEHCPVRPGTDLLHVHARDCRDGHAPDQCCECGETVRDFERMRERLASLTQDMTFREAGITPIGELTQPITDHAFVPTISGLCLRCQKSQGRHQPQVTDVTGMVAEPKMKTGRLMEWSRILRDYVPGDPKGPGRGELSPAWVEWAMNPKTRWLS